MTHRLFATAQKSGGDRRLVSGVNVVNPVGVSDSGAVAAVGDDAASVVRDFLSSASQQPFAEEIRIQRLGNSAKSHALFEQFIVNMMANGGNRMSMPSQIRSQRKIGPVHAAGFDQIAAHQQE